MLHFFMKTSLSLFGSQAFESVVQDLCLNEYTPTTTRIGYNNIISAANKIELAFQETCVTKMAGVFIIDKATTTTVDTTKYGCNDTVSTASETGLVFLEVLIAKMVGNSAAANISNSADSF